MNSTIKILGILAMSMLLTVSCKKDKSADGNDDNQDTGDKYKITTVSEALEKCKRVNWLTAPASNNGYSRIVKPESISQLKELLTKDKVYKKSEMSKEDFNRILGTVAMWSGPRHTSIAFAVEPGDMDALIIFHITDDENFAVCYTYGNSVYFQLEEGAFDFDKINAACVEGLEDPK